MSRDVSPEICGWCWVEEPCGCPNSLAKPVLMPALRVVSVSAHNGTESVVAVHVVNEADLTAAREAIRVLLGDAGLDGLGDLTTADGRSVVDIVRRGMGAGT